MKNTQQTNLTILYYTACFAADTEMESSRMLKIMNPKVKYTSDHMLAEYVYSNSIVKKNDNILEVSFLRIKFATLK